MPGFRFFAFLVAVAASIGFFFSYDGSTIGMVVFGIIAVLGYLCSIGVGLLEILGDLT